MKRVVVVLVALFLVAVIADELAAAEVRPFSPSHLLHPFGVFPLGFFYFR